MKVAILYHAQHHGNTKEVLKAIGENYKVELIDITERTFKNIGSYDVIGVASGIHSDMAGEMSEYIRRNINDGKKYFIIHNSEEKFESYAQDIEKMISEKKGKLLGKYGKVCYSGDAELSGAVDFYTQIIEEQRNNCLC